MRDRPPRPEEWESGTGFRRGGLCLRLEADTFCVRCLAIRPKSSGRRTQQRKPRNSEEVTFDSLRRPRSPIWIKHIHFGASHKHQQSCDKRAVIGRAVPLWKHCKGDTLQPTIGHRDQKQMECESTARGCVCPRGIATSIEWLP